MTWYAIMQKSTGHFLPAYGKSRCATTWEPSASKPPRLFRRLSDANSALEHWLKGQAYWKHDYGLSGSERTTMVHVPVASRNQYDMRIVPVRVEIVTL